MKSIFSVHMVFGIVDPQFETEEVGDIIDAIAKHYDIPITSGVAVLIPRPEPEDEEEETLQAVTPGTHEVNFVLDFDPNDESFFEHLDGDHSMCNKYNVANQICSTIAFKTFKEIGCIPTYFTIKISGDYVGEDVYEKIRKHRFNQ